MDLPGLSQVMFSRIPSYLAIAAGVALSALCFARRVKLSIGAAVASWLLSCLLMIATVLSFVLPMIRLQNALR